MSQTEKPLTETTLHLLADAGGDVTTVATIEFDPFSFEIRDEAAVSDVDPSTLLDGISDAKSTETEFDPDADEQRTASEREIDARPSHRLALIRSAIDSSDHEVGVVSRSEAKQLRNKTETLTADGPTDESGE
jgi:hypothetical protein